MKIYDLKPGDEKALHQVAEILVAGFMDHWPNAWPDIESGLEEANKSLESGKISRIASDENGNIVGWIGAIPEYNNNAWELHPLVVHPDYQGRGIGKALVVDLEAQVRARGGKTIYLGTDDEDSMTSLSGVDLYSGLWEHLANIQNLKGHPYEFYQKQGYSIVGVIPDANGLGKPDIIMAKRVR
jgi:aminoglycoside 6'-N-acetyltransferase I